MLRRIRGFIEFVIYSNVYIAIAAVMLTIEAQVQIGLSPGLHPYLFLVFFATLFEYNLHKFVVVFFYKHVLLETKFSWIARNKKVFYWVFLVSVAGLIASSFLARMEVLLVLFPLGVITFLYSFPVYKKGMKIFRLREIPLAKIFIISLVWSLTTILLPVIHSGVAVDETSLAMMILERFLFVFAITVPFDIRDMNSDKEAGLVTLPLLIGEKVSLKVAYFSIALSGLIGLVHYSITARYYLALAFVISSLLTLLCLYSKRIRSMRLYHYGILDGTMLLQGILVIFLWYLLGS